jgi:RNA polymerase sigma-70 factor (ECF subfamily)
LEAVAEQSTASADRLEERSQALARCIDRLPGRHRDLLQRRYRDGQAIEVVARQVRRSVDAVYRALSRIRRRLHDCVSRSLAQEGQT